MKSFVLFCCLVSLAFAKNKTLRECKNPSGLGSEPLLYLDIEECDNNCLNKDAMIVSGAFMISQPTETLSLLAYDKYDLEVDEDYADIVEQGEIKWVLEEDPNICDSVEPNCPFKVGQIVKFKREMHFKVHSRDGYVLEIRFIGDNEDFMYCSETIVWQKEEN